MSWKPKTQEIESIFRLTGPERYEYFIKKVADHQQVWGLWNDGWATICDDSGTMAIPVWPHEDFAQRCALAPWENYEPKLIDLEKWIAIWLPGLIRDNYSVAILPSPDGKGVIVNPRRLETDLKKELEQYE